VSKDTKLIFENWNKFQEIQQLDEGLWNSFKSGLAKMGTMDDLISVFSKNKRIEKQEAEEYIAKLFSKESNKFLQAFKKEIDGELEGFPNMKDEFVFYNGVAAIEQAYEDIIKATELDPKEEGHVPVAMANEMIQDLRDLVEYYSDKKLADVYKHFNEEQASHFSHLYLIYEKEFGNTNHTFVDWLNEDPVARFNLIQDVILTEEDEEDARARAGFQDKDAKQTRAMKGLKANTLPAILGLLGGAFTAGHFMAMSSGLGNPEIVHNIKAIDDFEQVMGQGVDMTASSGGLLKSLGNATGTGVAKTMGDFTSQIDKISSISNAETSEITSAISELMPSKSDGAKMMEYMYQYGKENPGENIFKIVNNKAPSSEFVQFVAGQDSQFAEMISQGASGAGTFKGGLTNILGISKGVAQVAAKAVVTKVGPKFVGGYTVSTMGAGTALVGSGALGMIGIGLTSAALAVKLARLKGEKSSRAQKLNDLFQKLEPLSAKAEITPVAAPKPETEPEPEDKVSTRPILVRLDDDGLKFHPSTARSNKGRDRDRKVQKSAQDQGVVGNNTSPSSDDLSRKFKDDRIDKVKNMSATDLATAFKKANRRSKQEVDPLITVDASIYKGVAKHLRKAGIKKGSRITKKMATAVDQTIEKILPRINKEPRDTQSVKKLTWKTVKRTLASQLKKAGLPDAATDEGTLLAILRAFKDYGLVRGDIPGSEPAAEIPAAKPKRKKKTVKEWKDLAYLFSK